MLHQKKKKDSYHPSKTRSFAFHQSPINRPIFFCLPFSQHRRQSNSQIKIVRGLNGLRELVDAVEVGKSLGDALGHGLLALADPDTGVVEPG